MGEKKPEIIASMFDLVFFMSDGSTRKKDEKGEYVRITDEEAKALLKSKMK
jgi:hypothetical protein